MVKKILYIPLFLMLACQDQKSEAHFNLKEPRYTNVKYERVQIDGLPAFFYELGTCIFENYLLLYENAPFILYHLVDLSNQKLIRTFGEEDGPNKINYPYCTCQLVKEGKSLFTMLNDGGHDHIMLQLNDVNNKQELTYKKIPYPELKMSTGSMYFSRNRKNLFGFYKAQSSIFKYDLNSQKVNLIPTGPDIKVNTDPISRSNIFYARTAVSQNLKMFAIAYSYFNLIEIYDSTFNLIQAISIGKPSTETPKIIDGIPVESTIRYSGFILLGEENIYVPFFNQEISEIANNNFIKILIINIKNHSIKGIKITEKITSFSVDAKENYLYATLEDDSNKEGNLIRINIKGLHEEK
jgi:hypothetical protein